MNQIDLFSENKSSEVEKRQNKIKELIKSGSKIHNFQNEVKKLTNYKNYESVRLEENKCFSKDSINNLYGKHENIFDVKYNSKDFSGNFNQRLFELVMADLLVEKYNLKERSEDEKNKGSTDFEFQYNRKKYIFEVTTRNAHLMNVFCEQLSTFSSHLQISTIFHQKTESLIQNIALWRDNKWRWYEQLNELWNELSNDDKERIKKLFEGISNEEFDIIFPKKMFEKLEDWIYLCEYALTYFKDILPSCMLSKLNEIFPDPVFLCKDTKKLEKDREFLMDSISSAVVYKWSKKYMQDRFPIIISVSLALLPDLQTHALFSGVDFDQLKIVIQEKSKGKVDKRKIDTTALSHLYAIIVDTTGLNWFPETYQAQNLAKFSGNHGNNYFIIYNKSISKEVDSDQDIFDSIINRKNVFEINLD